MEPPAEANTPENVLTKAAALRVQFRKELDNIKAELNRRENAGLSSLLDGLYGATGIPTDPNTASLPYTLSNANSYQPITLNRILLSYSYMTQGLLRTVVDQPVEDAFRGGIKFKTDELSPEELKKLNNAFKRRRPFANNRKGIAKVNPQAGYDLSNSDLDAVKYTAKWARLYGGAGLVVNTDQDFRKELDPEKIKEDSPLQFIAADRWELVLSQVNLFAETSETPYNYYGLPLHRTRVVRMTGAEAPSYIRLRLQGWGMSVLEECIRAVNAYIKFENLLFELLDEAKIDVYKIKGLNTALATDSGTEMVRRRITLSNQLKSYQFALSMDSEDEYHQKQLTWSGLAEIKEGLRTDLCAYLKFPKNKLFGESAGGFSSGKDSLDNYNSIVQCLREVIEPLLLCAGELRAKQMFGIVPEDLQVIWSPLDVLDGVEQEAVKTAKQNRISQLFSAGLITDKEAAAMLRAEELLTGEETEVEKGLRSVDPMEMMQQGGPGGEGNNLQSPKPRQKNAPKVPTQGATSHE